MYDPREDQARAARDYGQSVKEVQVGKPCPDQERSSCREAVKKGQEYPRKLFRGARERPEEMDLGMDLRNTCEP